MKNKELIKILQEYNPEADVTLTCSEDICISYIDFDGTETPKTTKQLFIEGIDFDEE